LGSLWVERLVVKWFMVKKIFILILTLSAVSNAEVKHRGDAPPQDLPVSDQGSSARDYAKIAKIYTQGEDCSKVDKNRGYFLSKISDLPVWQRSVLEITASDFKNQVVPFECIQKAQMLPTKGIIDLRQCDKWNNRKKVPQACVSTHYSSVLYNTYNRVMDCFGIPPKELFALINHESRFQVNAVSGNSCAGVGQITGGAVETLNRPKNWQQFGAEVVAKNQAEHCQPIKYIMERPQLQMNFKDKNNRCEAISMPESPLMNLVYTAMNHTMNRKGIFELIEAHSKRLPRGFSPKEKERLITQLTSHAYNVGLGETKRIYRTYITNNTMTRDKLDLLNPNSGFNTFLRKKTRTGHAPGTIKDKRRRHEVSHYMASVSKDLKLIEGSDIEKGQCSDAQLYY